MDFYREFVAAFGAGYGVRAGDARHSQRTLAGGTLKVAVRAEFLDSRKCIFQLFCCRTLYFQELFVFNAAPRDIAGKHAKNAKYNCRVAD